MSSGMSAISDFIDVIGAAAILSAAGVGLSWAWRVPAVRSVVTGAVEKQGKKVAEAVSKASK